MVNLIQIVQSFSRRRVWMALALGLVVALTPSVTVADPQTVLHPDPLSIGLRAGDEGSVSIIADDVQNMYGVEFHLQFDPNVVEVVDADGSKPGVQIKPDVWLKNSFVAVNKVDNGAGKIDYAVTLLNPAPAVSGSGTIATITFKAKNNGVSPLKIQKAILASREGKEIKSAVQDGAIGVSPVGVAPPADQTKRGGEESESSQGLPMREIVLVGIAGVGVLVFLGALAVVAGIFIFRRR